MEKEKTITAWVARDGFHTCAFLFAHKPEWDEDGWEYGVGEVWRDPEEFSVGSENGIALPDDMFPKLTKRKSPIQVELTIKVK